jgi:HK97 family phage major capsid protein
MNKEQVKRLRALLAKKAAERTSDEANELKKLLAHAEEHGVEVFGADTDDLQSSQKGAHEAADGDALTEAQVKQLVVDGVSEGFKALGFEPEKITQLTKALGEKQGASAEDIEEVVKAVLGGNGIDKDELSKLVEKAAQDAVQRGVSKADIQELFDEHVKQMRRSASKFALPLEADNPLRDFPIEHRQGNLSVGQKQLLNIMVDALPGMKEQQVNAIRDRGIPESLLTQAVQRGKAQLQRLRNAHVYGGKALTTGSATNGAELIPVDLSSDLLNRMYLESELAAEFVASEVQMPTDSFELPIRTTRPRFYAGAENPGSNPTESSPGTGKVTLSASKLIGRTNFSYEADEDSIIAVLPMVTENLAAAAADALEGAIINGDTAATQDSDASAGDDITIFNGLRKLCIAGSCKSSFASGGLDDANFLAAKKNMKRWGIRPRDVVAIVGVNGYNTLIGLPETLTADKVGSDAARILTGMAPTLFGIRILVSSQVREDLNASGVYDGSTTTKGSIYFVHRPSWIMGIRKGFTVEVDRDIQQQVNVVVASFRRAFKPLETISTNLPYAWMGYNYTA